MQENPQTTKQERTSEGRRRLARGGEGRSGQGSLLSPRLAPSVSYLTGSLVQMVHLDNKKRE